jgi:hypothetical protein
MQLDRGQTQLLGNFRIFNLPSLVKAQSLDALSHIRRARNGRSASKRLELDVRDDPTLSTGYWSARDYEGKNRVADSLFVDSDLELHNVSASTNVVLDNSAKVDESYVRFNSRRCAYKTRPDIDIALGHRPNLSIQSDPVSPHISIPTRSKKQLTFLGRS